MFPLPRNELQGLQVQQWTQEGIVPQFFVQLLPPGCLLHTLGHTSRHKWNTSSVGEEAECNQMGLTAAANTMTINCMKYSRSANVN